MGLFKKVPDGGSDPVLTRLAAEDKVSWYKKPNLRKLYIMLFFCCMGVEMTSGFDSQLINTLQFSQRFNKYFGNGEKDPKTKKYIIESAMLGFISSCYQLGSIIAVPIAPWINQRFGRRWSIMIGSLTMCVGALLQGFSQHIGMYIVARMLLGIGILFCIISGAAMIGELAYPNERPIMTSLFNSSWFIGAVISAGIAIKTADINSDWSWRLPSLLQICPSLLQIGTVFFLPESPRWLISKDRDDEAFAILTKYHAEGDASSIFVKAEMAQIKSTLKIEQELEKQSWLDMLRTAGMRRRTLISAFLGLFTQMSGNTLLGFYSGLLFEMMGYTSNYAKTRINIAYQSWGGVTSTLFALFVTQFPRRKMFMTSAAAMTLCFMSMTIAFWHLRDADNHKTKNHSAQIAALFFYFAYQPCYNLGNNALTYTYLVELWPYHVRTRGIGIQQIFGKGGGFFSTNVNPIALRNIDWKYMAIYCGWIAFEFIFIYLFYPETYNRTLEELAFLFEDKELGERSAAAVEKQIHYGDADPDQDHGAIHLEEQPNNKQTA